MTEVMTAALADHMSRSDGLALYDLSRWKPLTTQRFAELLGACTTTFDEPDQLVTKVEGLPDGRVRLVTCAMLITSEGTDAMPPKAEHAPYLMQLYSPERGESFYFMRTDADLALS